MSRFLVRALAAVGAAALLVLLVASAYLGWLLSHGFGALDDPSAVEATLARTMRSVAIPASAKRLKNPLPQTPEIVREGLEHWADHCASCHGNDGSGRTAIGQNLYPRAPDMREDATQDQTDGELFYVIQNGVRLTGMPAWGREPGHENQTWALVHFIRHLPKLTDAELEAMASLNPKTPADLQEEQEEEQFLNQGDPPTENTPHHH